MVKRAQIVAEAKSWLKTPYHHQASRKGVGVDCIGLIRGVARNCGLDDPFETGAAHKYFGYSQMPNPALLLEACTLYLQPIAIKDIALGDVLLFNFADRGVKDPQHFGILTQEEPPYVIHSLAPHCVLEHRINEVWQGRIMAAFTLRGVE
jgi:NlpC/P60 family putative phage cell wall peptidase